VIQAVTRLEGTKPILHSNQGWQYQMVSYQTILRENGIQQRIGEELKAKEQEQSGKKREIGNIDEQLKTIMKNIHDDCG